MYAMTFTCFPRFLIPVLMGILVLAGCASTDQIGSTGTSATDPSAAHDPSRLDSLRTKRGGFTSNQDTVVASVVKTSRSSGRIIKPIERPENPAYTVQVGAFARTMYALQSQKLAKERFPSLPIFNTFESFDRLYRVRVGKFDTWRGADSLRKAMVKLYPEEYHEAWVNYIAQ